MVKAALLLLVGCNYITDSFESNNFSGDPFPIADNLSIHEVNIQKEIKRHWREISAYVVSVLRTTGTACSLGRMFDP